MRTNDSLSVLMPLTPMHQSQTNEPSCAACVGSIGRWSRRMVIQQGDIFWIELDEPSGSKPGYRHPHVVIQNNVFNRGHINTVVVCTLTSNLRRATAPGNVLLEPEKANLPSQVWAMSPQFLPFA